MKITDKRIDKSSPIPIYYQLKQIILELIRNGDLRPEDSIPTEAELNEQFNISRTTSRQALTELVREGYLYRVKGKGTFVATPPITQDFLNKLESYSEQMHRLNKTPSTKVLALTVVPAARDVSEALRVAEGEDVILLSRLRFADNQPNVVVDTYLPDSCQSILREDMTKKSLYHFLADDMGCVITCAQRELEATIAGKRESELLEVRKGYPIQLVRTVAYDDANVPVEYSIARYKGGNKFNVVLHV